MTPRCRLFILALACTVAMGTGAIGTTAWAAETDPARLLPESAIVYLHIAQPAELLDAATDSAVYDKLMQINVVQKALAGKEVQQLKQGIGLLEEHLKIDWKSGLKELAGGGIHLAIEPQTQAVIVIVKSRNAPLLNKLHDAVQTFIADEAQNRGKPSPIKLREHKGVSTWSSGLGEQYAIVGDLFLASNKIEALQQMLDRLAAPQREGLAGKPEFQEARQRCEGAAAWGTANLALLHVLPQMAGKFAPGKQHPLTEMFAGGVLDAITRAPLVTVSLRRSEVSSGGSHWSLRSELPFDSKAVAEPRRWFFADDTSGAAPRQLRPKQTIAALSMQHDFSGLWGSREQLFDEATNAKFTQADSGLGLYFSGRDFGPEVLGQLQPRWQLIAARREFKTDEPVPSLKLPAFALAFELKDEAFSTPLLLAFQNAVAIGNVVGLQMGKPQMLLSSETYHEAVMTITRRIATAAASSDEVPVDYNFSPACVQFGKHFLICTTTELAHEMVDLLRQPSTTDAAQDNTLLEIDGTALWNAFNDDRALLVSKYMLTEGTTREESEAYVAQVLELARLFSQASLALQNVEGSLRVEATLDTRDK